MVCDLGPGAESEGKASTETAKPRQKFASEPGAVGELQPRVKIDHASDRSDTIKSIELHVSRQAMRTR